ncbi:uncharacterized protein LOC109714178 isoform X2 [Ananas comosus]|uniref:Uncharacterized protein LOC109714178 isoform X2 n=1 Tax=Ananas comosus TaxID=4615 RepID=A0A6P5FDC3_ANACO|nr:uncharacterized protein LOC109714178 isoform X2 [Ananas comosus]
MAVFNFHCFHFVLPPIRSFSDQHISIPFPSATSSSPPFHLRSANAISKKRNRRAPNPIRASSEGIPSEVIEDSKFVPLNADDPIYGPPALLLLGFEADETEKVIHCTEDMMKQTVWDAMHTELSNVEDVKIAKSLPRVCLLSGLTGEEMMMFIDAYPETGLKPAVFAALVPNSANKLLADVVEEIMGDHEMLSGKKSD